MSQNRPENPGKTPATQKVKGGEKVTSGKNPDTIARPSRVSNEHFQTGNRERALGQAAGSMGAAKLIKLNIIALGSCLALSVANMGLLWYGMSSKTEIIAVTEDGRISNPVPLNEPFVPEARILGFVDECLRASFAHDFENYRRTFNAVLPCYTSLGGKAFAQAIDPWLVDIRDRRLVMSVTSEPPGLKRGPMLVGGRVVWEVETVLTLYFQGTREQFAPQRRVATVTVVRVPVEESVRGVAINAIQLAPYTK